MPGEVKLQKLLSSIVSAVDDLYTVSVIIRLKPLSYDMYLKSSQGDIAVQVTKVFADFLPQLY